MMKLLRIPEHRWNRIAAGILEEDQVKKINLQVHYIPIHLQPFYKKKYNYKLGDFPIAEKFYYQEISLPIYYSLKKLEVYKVAKYLKKYCN